MPSFTVIPHEYNGHVLQQRPGDGYFNATLICKAAGRRFNHYKDQSSTSEYLQALSADTGIPATGLIQIRSGGRPELQGTWVHPDVATHLAQWCSPEFAILVSRLVRSWWIDQVHPASESDVRGGGAAELPEPRQLPLPTPDPAPVSTLAHPSAQLGDCLALLEVAQSMAGRRPALAKLLDVALRNLRELEVAAG